MPSVGESRTKFGRQYVFVNPNANEGPGNWRLSTIDSINDSGGGGGEVSNIDGIVPIISTTVDAGDIDISIDISRLDEKA